MSNLIESLNEDSLSKYIYLQDGAIVVDSRLEKIVSPNSLKILISCCEDNIKEYADPYDYEEERIKYYNAWDDFVQELIRRN